MPHNANPVPEELERQATPALPVARGATGSGLRCTRPLDRPNNTAGRAISATRRLLEREGYEALTLSAINEEAGIANKTMARYYFGSKDSLVELAMRQAIDEYFSAIFAPLPVEMTVEERIDAYIEALGEMHRTSAFLGFFTVLPHVLRNEALRRKLQVAYDECHAKFVALFFLDERADTESRERLGPIAELATAANDGLAIQCLIHGGVRDLDSFLANLRTCLHLAVAMASSRAARS